MRPLDTTAARGDPPPGAGEAEADEIRARLLVRVMPRLVHRMNNSLAVAGGLSELLLTGEGDPERAQRLRAVSEEAYKCAALVRDLARLGQPRDPGRNLVDLGETAASACAFLESLGVAGRRVEARRRGEMLIARGDPAQLFQLAVAFLADALLEDGSRSPEPGPVRARCTGVQRAGGVQLLLSWRRPGHPPGAAALGPAARLLASWGGRLGVRGWNGRAWCLRLSLPAHEGLRLGRAAPPA